MRWRYDGVGRGPHPDPDAILSGTRTHTIDHWEPVNVKGLFPFHWRSVCTLVSIFSCLAMSFTFSRAGALSRCRTNPPYFPQQQDKGHIKTSLSTWGAAAFIILRHSDINRQHTFTTAVNSTSKPTERIKPILLPCINAVKPVLTTHCSFNSAFGRWSEFYLIN